MKITIDDLIKKGASTDILKWYQLAELEKIDWSEVKVFKLANFRNYEDLKWLIARLEIDDIEIYVENDYSEWEKRRYGKRGKLIYYETHTGYIEEQEYNENWDLVSINDNRGYATKIKYDENGNQIHWEFLNGEKVLVWNKFEYDENNKLIDFSFKGDDQFEISKFEIEYKG